MPFLKKTVVVLASFFFGLSLVITLLLFQIKFTFGNEAWVKNWLDSSGVYQKIVPTILPTLKGDGDNSIPFADPGIVSAVNKVFPAQFLGATTEQVIDQTYAWLGGEKTDPKITIDLSTKRLELAEAVGVVAKARIDKLPKCAPDYIPPGPIDVFTATCVPPYITTESLAQSVSQDLKNSKDFLGSGKLTISASDIAKNAPGFSSTMPKVYKLLSWLPWVLLGWLVLSLVGIIAWAENRRKRIKRLIFQLLIVGGFFVGGAILFARAENKLSGSITKAEDPIQQKVIDELFRPLIISAGRDIMRIQMIFGIVLLTIAAGGLTWLFITKTKKPKTDKKDGQEKESPKPEAENTTADKKEVDEDSSEKQEVSEKDQEDIEKPEEPYKDPE